MNEPTQLDLFNANLGRIQRRVVYVSPDPKTVDQFAHEVCQRLDGKEQIEPGDELIVNGFSEFLYFVAQITTKHLNRKGEP